MVYKKVNGLYFRKVILHWDSGYWYMLDDKMKFIQEIRDCVNFSFFFGDLDKSIYHIRWFPQTLTDEQMNERERGDK